MDMSSEVLKFVREHWVKQANKNSSSIQELKSLRDLYRKAGYFKKASQIQQQIYEIQIQIELERLRKNYIILKKPRFESILVDVPRKYRSYWDEKWKYSGYRLSSKFSIRTKYLFEIDPSNYKGHIPLKLVEETIKARESGFKPMIWAIATEREIIELSVGEEIGKYDPLLVGYIPDISGYVVLLGIWGKDIEDLDKLFSSM